MSDTVTQGNQAATPVTAAAAATPRGLGGISCLEDFEELINRNFRQPPEGLGHDDSPSSHMWRTMIWPNNFL